MDPPRAVQVGEMFLEDHVLQHVFGQDLAAVEEAPEAVVHGQLLPRVEADCELEKKTGIGALWFVAVVLIALIQGQSCS